MIENLDFSPEIEAAVKAFDQYVVCLKMTPEDFKKMVQDLVKKAIEAFKNRQEGTRSAVSFSRWVTVTITQRQVDGQESAVCGIYLNLSSPHTKNLRPSIQKIED